MKRLIRDILLPFCFVITGAVFANAMDVTVSDSRGALAFKGKTNANDSFATGDLKAGEYVVQFNSRDAADGSRYALVISAGKQKVVADAVAGSKFATGGVAMKVLVGKGLKITGHVLSLNLAAADGMNSTVKVMNGRRYFWVREIGSNFAGRWVEEGTPAASNVTTISPDGIRNLQDRGTQGSGPGR